jgi:Flp pilus assembly pilin Flp
MEVSMSTFSTQEAGQTLAEYAVVMAVITLLIIGAIGALSGQISAIIGTVAAAL